MANEDAIPLLSVSNCQDDDEHTPPQYTRRDPSPVRSQSPVRQMTTPFQYPQMGASQQMSNTSTVVVAGQPASHLPPVSVVQQSRKPSQGILIFSLVLIAVCPLVCNFGSFCMLIPGVIFALVGFNFSHSHDPTKRQTGRGFSGVSLCCSVTALISYIVTVACVILFYSILFGIRYSPSPHRNCFDSCHDECHYDSTGAQVCSNVCSSCR